MITSQTNFPKLLVNIRSEVDLIFNTPIELQNQSISQNLRKFPNGDKMEG